MKTFSAEIGGRQVFMRYLWRGASQITLLFLHGLGDASSSYSDFLSQSPLSSFNVLAPDLVGYGESAHLSHYTFEKQAKILSEQLDAFERYQGESLERLVLVCHSMGAVFAEKIDKTHWKSRVLGIVNIEGTLTSDGSFASEKIAENKKKGVDMLAWFDYFKENIVLNDYVKKFPLSMPYFLALQKCDPLAFIENGLELREICLAGKGKYSNSVGDWFAHVDLPKVYFYGEGLGKTLVECLKDLGIPHQCFETECHFIFLAQARELALAIQDWVNCHIQQGEH